MSVLRYSERQREYTLSTMGLILQLSEKCASCELSVAIAPAGEKGGKITF